MKKQVEWKLHTIKQALDEMSMKQQSREAIDYQILREILDKLNRLDRLYRSLDFENELPENCRQARVNFSLERFKNSEIQVYCETEGEAAFFLGYVRGKGISWGTHCSNARENVSYYVSRINSNQVLCRREGEYAEENLDFVRFNFGDFD
jgi:hypothetical protein